jgi:hypothetical protein
MREADMTSVSLADAIGWSRYQSPTEARVYALPRVRLCADWLKTFVTEVPIAWIPAGDPFWRP